MKANLRFIVALLVSGCVFSEAGAQITIQSQSGNRVKLSISPPPTNPLNTTTFEALPQGTPWRRFQAFWVMGDGNFLEFRPSPTDEASLSPADYFYDYAVSDTFRANAYLTGKYTNTTPPPEYLSPKIILDARGGTSPFSPRLDPPGKRLDIHSNHAIRKGNLTVFVVSYPAADDIPDKRLYFFYNGRRTGAVGNPSAFSTSVVKYNSTNIPQYFLKGNSPMTQAAITERFSATLPPGLRNFSGAYSNFIAYPRENVQVNEMPFGFSEKRQFPVLLADPSGTVTLTSSDSLLSFVAILTGSKPLNPDVNGAEIQQIAATLASIGITNLNPLEFLFGVDSSVEYIIAAEEKILPYMAAFDPNQLTVENIQPVGNGEYLVTFRLDICNSGAGTVEHENIAIHYVPGTFWGFNYPTQAANYHYQLDPASKDGEWRFDIQMMLPGVEPADASGHKEECGFIRFTALTDCNGVRSLWAENGGLVVEACVVFKESFNQEPECHYNYPIKSDQFKDSNGKCFCCPDECERDGDIEWWHCLLLLLIILLILLWLVKSKYIPWLSKLFS